ncbi:hypothetical protein CBR_g10834 [Chara braunii]|uniref:Uncharacterized protein n=1 Tax=Chara braunii TaxID=69332 RepID=A0A388KPG7_CHABU|nr:hypothetical protein CBR_g10834 [Chara braunii]|eukprot:GBG71898.1 hypothetical protein CBR_g10834 [Chara braunii]
MEREERARKEEEELRAKEAERAAKEERAARRAAEKKKKEPKEDKLEFTKVVRMDVAMCIGGFQEKMQDQMRRNMKDFQSILKGKQRAASPSGSTGSYTSDRGVSEVEELSNKAERLVISEKRKRSPDGPVGDSPPVTLSPKRTPRKTGVKPVKLATKLQAATGTTTKKFTAHGETTRTPTRYTQRKGTPTTKIAAKIRSATRAKFIGDNMRVLAEYQAEDLKRMCKRDEVEYGNKVITVINIAEKRVEEAYGEADTEGEGKAEDVHETMDSVDEASDDGEDE